LDKKVVIKAPNNEDADEKPAPASRRRTFVVRLCLDRRRSRRTKLAEGSKEMIALSNRAHLYAGPSVREALVECITTVLGCGTPVSIDAPGLAEPILAWNFPNGGSLSVEFTDEALDAQHARRGAWLELTAEAPSTVMDKLREAGLAELEYLGRAYFVLPGGQVVRIAPAGNP
jgi:hypothetical protein